PFIAALFVPLLPLPHLLALGVTALLEAAATAAAMLLAARLAGVSRWYVLALAALAQPLALDTWLTVQPAPLVTLAWAGFALCYARGRRDLAAMWIIAA